MKNTCAHLNNLGKKPKNADKNWKEINKSVKKDAIWNNKNITESNKPKSGLKRQYKIKIDKSLDG